jgi:ATP phosphoribosyltransferase regulatory subunit
MMHTREPLQIGAELYGHAGVESDIEIQALMVNALHLTGVGDLHVDLGNVAVFRSLVQRGGLAPELESELFQALQSKDVPALRELVAGMPPPLKQALLLLPELYGGPEVIDTARARLPAHPEIVRALDDLGAVARDLSGMVQVLCFDLADLRGYHYHSGMVFAAYARGRPNAIALGGRYDEVGKAFGRARPATGFTMDLRELAGLAPAQPEPAAILAPFAPGDTALQAQIAALRARGEVVVLDLPGHESTRAELNCDRRLVQRGGEWVTQAEH